MDDIRVMGRATQVRLINLKDGDSIASITKAEQEEETEEQGEGEGAEKAPILNQQMNKRS